MESGTTEQQLLQMLPSDEATRALVERYSRLVFSACFGILQDRDRADDASQTVFLLLLKRAALLNRHPSLAGWLYTTSLRVSMAMKRGDQRRTLREREAATGHQPAPSAELLDLADAIKRLGNFDRELILLRYAQDLSFPEIAETLNISADAVRMRINRALDKMRRRLGGAEVLSVMPLLFATRPDAAHIESSIYKGLISHQVATAPIGIATMIKLHLPFAFNIALPVVATGLLVGYIAKANLPQAQQSTTRVNQVGAVPATGPVVEYEFSLIKGGQKMYSPKLTAVNGADGHISVSANQSKVSITAKPSVNRDNSIVTALTVDYSETISNSGEPDKVSTRTAQATFSTKSGSTVWLVFKSDQTTTLITDPAQAKFNDNDIVLQVKATSDGNWGQAMIPSTQAPVQYFCKLKVTQDGNLLSTPNVYTTDGKTAAISITASDTDYLKIKLTPKHTSTKLVQEEISVDYSKVTNTADKSGVISQRNSTSTFSVQPGALVWLVVQPVGSAKIVVNKTDLQPAKDDIVVEITTTVQKGQ